MVHIKGGIEAGAPVIRVYNTDLADPVPDTVACATDPHEDHHGTKHFTV